VGSAGTGCPDVQGPAGCRLVAMTLNRRASGQAEADARDGFNDACTILRSLRRSVADWALAKGWAVGTASRRVIISICSGVQERAEPVGDQRPQRVR
jgi:hypothetical protein